MFRKARQAVWLSGARIPGALLHHLRTGTSQSPRGPGPGFPPSPVRKAQLLRPERTAEEAGNGIPRAVLSLPAPNLHPHPGPQCACQGGSSLALPPPLPGTESRGGGS